MPEAIVPPVEPVVPPVVPPVEPVLSEADKNALSYQLRKANETAAAYRKELDTFKQAEEAKRQAALTEQQRLQEERDTLTKELQETKLSNLRAKVASEYKLPTAFIDRLQGTDEISLKEDAETLAALIAKPVVGSTTNPTRETGGNPRTYKRSELRADAKLAASPEVMKAFREGRITND